MNQRAIPELSIDTQTIERLLLDVQVGDVISYKDMSEAIGRDVQASARHVVTSACNRLLKQYHMVFETVWGQGLKRLDDSGVLSAGVRTLKRIHNAARRGARKIAAVQSFDNLTNEQKVKHNLMAAQFGMLSQVTSERVAKRLEKATQVGGSPMPTAKLLEAMKNSL